MSASRRLALPLPEGGARHQIGGVMGARVEPFTLARFRRALGANHLLLAAPTSEQIAGGWDISLVAEWDGCYLGGSPIVGVPQWERVVKERRLSDVEGAFSLAWVDRDRTVHLVRDRVGERGLFYARVGDGIAFASTIRPLLTTRLLNATLSIDAVATYLSYGYIPGSETLVEDVHELLPGEHVLFQDGEFTREHYWQLPPEDDGSCDEDEYRISLREHLEAAVARRLPLSGTVAATLSGGVDSSLVACLVAANPEVRLATYSLSFGRDMPNELSYASLVAARCGSDHHVVELSPRAVIERFDATIAALSKPIGEPLTVANSILFEASASHSSVVFNGEGGDPAFGGPKNIPMVLNELYGAPTRDAQPGGRESAYLLAHRKCFAELERALAPDVACAARERLEQMLAVHFEDPRWTTLVNRLMALNVTFKGAHHILPKVDHLSRPLHVLPQSPLFDSTVVALAARMPARLKLNGLTEKYILKRAVEDIVPPEIIARPKSGMRVPVERWLEGRFERFARERLLDGLASYGIVRRGYLEELARPRERRPPRRGAKVWLLLSLEAWLRTVLDPR